jgi:hypothetical protein
MSERPLLPSPDRVLRVAAFAVLGAVAGSGMLAAFGSVDLLDHLDWAPSCAIRTFIGFDCPGCGMTRALVLLGQMEFAAACNAHPAAPGFVLALGAGIVCPDLVSAHRNALVRAALLFVLVAWWFRLGV